MCKISAECMCHNLSEFVKNDKYFRIEDLFKRQQQSSAYAFLTMAAKIDRISNPKDLLKKCEELASNFLLQKVPTGDKKFVYQFNDDGVCPDSKIGERFTHYLIKLQGLYKKGQLPNEDRGVLKDRLLDVVQTVQHHTFPELMRDVQFKHLMKLGKENVDATVLYKEGLKPLKREQGKKDIQDVMEALNMGTDGQKNSKTGVSISH